MSESQEVLWHKTPEWKVLEVLKDGLDPRFSATRTKAIYLADARSKRRLGVELGIRKELLDLDKLEIDKVLVSGVTHYKYYATIPPDAIFQEAVS